MSLLIAYRVTRTLSNLSFTAVSLRSRAARRGESPPSKDLAAKAPVDETEHKPWMHNVQSAGIGKRKKVKQLTRQQKARQQKALEKADAIVNKHERKVEDSKARAKRVQARSKDWEDLNQGLSVKTEQTPKATTTQTDKRDGADGREMEDVQLPDMEQSLPTQKREKVTPSEVQTIEPAASDVAAAEEVDDIT